MGAPGLSARPRRVTKPAFDGVHHLTKAPPNLVPTDRVACPGAPRAGPRQCRAQPVLPGETPFFGGLRGCGLP